MCELIALTVGLLRGLDRSGDGPGRPGRASAPRTGGAVGKALATVGAGRRRPRPSCRPVPDGGDDLRMTIRSGHSRVDRRRPRASATRAKAQRSTCSAPVPAMRPVRAVQRRRAGGAQRRRRRPAPHLPAVRLGHPARRADLPEPAQLVEPIALAGEAEALAALGVPDPLSLITVDPDALITTPVHAGRQPDAGGRPRGRSARVDGSGHRRDSLVRPGLPATRRGRVPGGEHGGAGDGQGSGAAGPGLPESAGAAPAARRTGPVLPPAAGRQRARP